MSSGTAHVPKNKVTFGGVGLVVEVEFGLYEDDLQPAAEVEHDLPVGQHAVAKMANFFLPWFEFRKNLFCKKNEISTKVFGTFRSTKLLFRFRFRFQASSWERVELKCLNR